ncbi:MAG: hypothetical protein JWM80_3708, partial [Cyanobacteria bacterium RYN_339]|nr:hypothetical protein [Cyanobacteria bacterium RYN_339]
MRAVRSSLPLILFALVACGPVTSTGTKTAAKSPKPTTATSVQATPKASPAASSAPAPKAALLVRPTGDVKVVAGVVRIDAAYAVGSAGAKLV